MTDVKRPRTAAQLANDERLRNSSKSKQIANSQVANSSADGSSPAPEPNPAQAAPVAPQPTPPVEQTAEDSPATTVQDTPDLTAMQRQMDEIMETNALLKAALLRGNAPVGNSNDSVSVGRGNQLVGEVDKYLVDSAHYPDPTRRLAQEPRLQPIAFNHNYELEYNQTVRSYETKTGVNMREPEFTIHLLRVVLDDQGNRVQIKDRDGNLKDKFYIARRLMFHEDPQAALTIARENNLDVDKSDEKAFLDEMRYLRVRDWLFDYFWPKPAQSQDNIREEVVGGTLVQVYTKSSVEPSSVDFDALHTKVTG